MSTQGKAAPALGHLAGLGKPLIVLRRAEPVSGLLTVLANQLAQELTSGLLVVGMEQQIHRSWHRRRSQD
jgi:hypothetical protein